MRSNTFYLNTKDIKPSEPISTYFLKLGLLYKSENTKTSRERKVKVKSVP